MLDRVFSRVLFSFFRSDPALPDKSWATFLKYPSRSNLRVSVRSFAIQTTFILQSAGWSSISTSPSLSNPLVIPAISALKTNLLPKSVQTIASCVFELVRTLNCSSVSLQPLKYLNAVRNHRADGNNNLVGSRVWPFLYQRRGTVFH